MLWKCWKFHKKLLIAKAAILKYYHDYNVYTEEMIVLGWFW